MRERLLTILAMASVVAVLGQVSLTVGDVHVPLTMGLGRLTIAHVAGAILVVPAMARLADLGVSESAFSTCLPGVTSYVTKRMTREGREGAGSRITFQVVAVVVTAIASLWSVPYDGISSRPVVGLLAGISFAWAVRRTGLRFMFILWPAFIVGLSLGMVLGGTPVWMPPLVVALGLAVRNLVDWLDGTREGLYIKRFPSLRLPSPRLSGRTRSILLGVLLTAGYVYVAYGAVSMVIG